MDEESYLKEALKKSREDNERLKGYLGWAALIAFFVACYFWGGDRF